MRTETLRIAETPADLLTLDVGTRIYTAAGEVMDLDELENGSRYWIVPGTLRPFSRPGANWFPAVILEPNKYDLFKSADKGCE